MTAMDQEQHEGALETPAATPASQDTLISRLRERRQKVADDTTIDIPIAPLGGELVARYRLLDPKELAVIRRKVERQFDGNPDAQELNGNADALIAACIGFFVRRDDGTLQPLDEAAEYPPELGPITYEDARLGEQFEFEASSAREALFALFGKPLAAGPHGREYAEWLTGARVGEAEETLGES